MLYLQDLSSIFLPAPSPVDTAEKYEHSNRSRDRGYTQDNAGATKIRHAGILPNALTFGYDFPSQASPEGRSKSSSRDLSTVGGYDNLCACLIRRSREETRRPSASNSRSSSSALSKNGEAEPPS